MLNKNHAFTLGDPAGLLCRFNLDYNAFSV